MFQLKPNPTFWTRVEIHVPGGDPESVEFEFRHMDRDALARFCDGLPIRPPLQSLTEIVANWRGIDAEFTQEALERLNRDYVSAADRIVTTYLEELRGARRKN